MAKRFEQYQDMVARLYPTDKFEDESGRKILSRPITFCVTNACQLRCTYCLPAGTQIKMADFSSKPIEDIVEGDEILGFEEYIKEKGKHTKLQKGTVEKLYHRKSPTVTIVFENGEELTITKNHKVLVRRNTHCQEYDYKEAGKLKIGQTVYGLPYFDVEENFDNAILKRIKITDIKENDEEVDVYNIGTTCRTYIANNIAVHNCYEHHKGNSFMKFETAKKFIDLLLSGDKGMSDYINPEISPAVMLEFIGGEPFLAIDLMDEIMDYWMDRTTELMHPWADKFMVSICSNGVAYFDPKVQKFLNKHKDHMSFSITIDGNKELHDACRVYAGTNKGCYDEAMAAAEDWMRRGNYMGSKVTLAPENLEYMYDAIMHMVDKGYYEILGNCVYEAEWTNKQALLFYEQGKKLADEFLRRNMDFDKDYYCSLFEPDYFHPKDEHDIQNWCGGANSQMISCDWDGEIYPCIRYMEMSLGNAQPKLPIGNVDDGIMQLPEHKGNSKCLNCIDRRSQSTDECFYCPIAEGCSWCSAYNYELYGTPNKRCTRICPMHKSRALFNYYFWNKYYLANGIDKYMEIHIPEEWALEIISKEEFDVLKELEHEAKTEHDKHIVEL